MHSRRMDGSTALGFVIAMLAAACYDTGYAVQALEARRGPPARALRLSLYRYLAARRLWLIGIGLMVLGWPLQLLALALAPLTLVQPTLTLGLLLLLALGARVLHERVGVREIAGVVAIVVGVAGIAIVAPERTDSHAGAAELVPVLAGLGLVAAAPYLFRLRSWWLVFAAGAGDAWAAFAAKLVVDEVSLHHWLPALGFALAAGAAVGIGFLSELTALQTQPATRVGPTVLAIDVVIPVLLAPLVGGEHWTNAALVLVSLAVVTSGVVVLASSRSVADVLQHE
jgi:drug/metabolite transporter (DMT)-like permease